MLGLQHVVDFRCGSICYTEFDCLIHTSEFEGLPNVFIEALGNGIPVVSTYFTTGLLELFIPFWVYVSSADSKALASQILLALSNSHRTKRLTASIPELISSCYSLESQSTDLSYVLDYLMRSS